MSFDLIDLKIATYRSMAIFGHHLTMSVFTTFGVCVCRRCRPVSGSVVVEEVTVHPVDLYGQSVVLLIQIHTARVIQLEN